MSKPALLRPVGREPATVWRRGRRLVALAIAALVFAGPVLGGSEPADAQTVPSAPPARPTGLTGTFTHDAVSLSWDDPADTSITSYQVLRRDADVDAPGEFIVHVDDTGSAATSYTDTDVVAGTRYVYRVKARNSAGLSQRSSYFNAYLPAAPDPPTALPAAPTNLTATASGETQIALSWSTPEGVEASSILGYRIEVSNGGESEWADLIANTASATTTYAHSDLAPATTRHYRVSAITSAGTGAPSNVASATTADHTAPSLTSGAVGASGETLELAFDEPLDLGAGKAPPAGAFAVTADGATVAVGAVEAVGDAPQSIRLTGLTPAITPGQAVSVSYTDPSSEDDEAAVQDLAGNDAASFSGAVAANESAVADSDNLDSATGDRTLLAPTTVQQISEILAAKARRTSAQRKVSSQLLEATEATQPAAAADGDGSTSVRGAGDGADESRAVPEASGQPSDGAGVVGDAGTVEVDIRADVTAAVLARILELGGTVIDSVAKYRAIRAVLPIAAVEKLASLEAVDSIRPADRAFTRKLNTTQGDVAHRVNTARTTHGVTGAGIGIGVISDGVETLAARQRTGDVPGNVFVLPGQEGRGDEGTAILEIVHDLAPDAQLFFATGFGSQARFAANIEALCDAGANVIIDDIGYYAEAAFQDDIIARGVNAAVADGCYYFSSGGNLGNLNDGTSSVWEGDYSAGSALIVGGQSVGTRHDFGGGTEENGIGRVRGVIATLQWADPLGASANDYDLFLIDAEGNVLRSSTDTQDGSQDPVELIDTAFFGARDARLVIVKVSGDDRYLRLVSFESRLSLTTAGNTWGHSAAENAIGVGAVDVGLARGAGGVFNGTESVRRSSSDGPRRIFFEPDGTAITPGNFSATGGRVLQKPDLVAATCVRTSTPGFGTFCGTSASAPHAAAIAALAVESAGGPGEVTLTELHTAMTASTAVLDIEAAGTDRDSGAGIVMAPGAIDGLDVPAATRNHAPTLTTAIPDRSVEPGSAAITIDLTTTFSDPESDTLTYTIANEDPTRVMAAISGAQLTLTPASPGRSMVRLRATDPDGLAAMDIFTVTVAVGNMDYDTDDNDLIEVSNLAQLDAIRYDLDGDGHIDGSTWQAYLAAFPMGAIGMGCPNECDGYELSADLDFDTNSSGAADAGDTYWNNGAGWAPIGSASAPYTGVFQGHGHTISNLFIDRPTEDGVGLFGDFDGITVRNVGLLDVDVTGRDHVGSLVGRSIRLPVTASYATGRVTGADGVGGLVGESSGSVMRSYAAVTVSGDEAVGGLVGHLTLNAITSSYATGAVSGRNAVGGLLGAASGSIAWIEDSYATGPVSGSGASLSTSASVHNWCASISIESPGTSIGGGVGGLAGHACGAIEASYSSGTVSGTTAVGGLVGTGDRVFFGRGSYWDIEASGRRVGHGIDDANNNGIIDGNEADAPGLQGLVTSELQVPTGYTGIYSYWEVRLGAAYPWDFGTVTQYPALEQLGSNAPSWPEFGYQFRGPIPLSATTAANQGVLVSWTAPTVSHWSPAPTISYTLYRDAGTGFSVLASALTGTTYTDTTTTSGTRYTYRLAAVINGGEFGRSAPLAVTAGVANQPPLAATPLADQTIPVGGSAVTVGVASAFREPEGDTLTYTASSTQTSVATVSVSGSQVTVTPLAGGRAIITVTATDASGSNSSATQRFTVTVGHDYDTDGDRLIEITTLAQLDAIRYDLHGLGTPSDRVAYSLAFPAPIDFMGCGIYRCRGYELMADLDFDTNGNGSADAGDTYWNGGAGWAPIGISLETFPFGTLRATFDGNGHTIANLFISREAESYIGLFRGIGPGGLIRNVNLTDVDVLGNLRVGGLAGVNLRSVIACHVSGAVKGDHAVGGLVGNNYYRSIIERSRSFVAVTAPYGSPSTATTSEEESVGGLVGTNYGRVTASYATGSVSATGTAPNLLLGGLVGWNTGLISASYATGAVTGSTAGGVVGMNEVDVIATYASGRVSGDTAVGGLAGDNTHDLTGSYSTGPVSATTGTSGGLAGMNTGSTTSSYWDATTSGVTGGRTTAALSSPTGTRGIYKSWNLDVNADNRADSPWSFGTSSQYPALSVDFDGDGTASWQEFGHQLRAGPGVTAEAGKEQVVVSWSAVDTSTWAPRPDVTYTVYRDGAVVAENLAALDYVDSSLTAASYTYQLAAVVDGGEATHSPPVPATVSASATNTAPVASVTAPPVMVDAGATVTLDATATDAESDTLTYAWRSVGGGTFADASALDTTWTAPAETNVAQHILLILTVTDDGVGTLTDTVIARVTVRPNEAPTASITTAPATVNGRGLLTLAATAMDPEMGTLSYRWTSSGGGTFADATALGTTWTAPVATAATQTITLTLVVTDPGDATDVAMLVVEVRPNQAPEVSVVPTDATVSGRATVMLDGMATDPDGDTLVYKWTSGGGGQFNNAAALDTVFTAPPKTNEQQTIVLTLTVTDSGAGRLASTARVRITVPANEPPMASITTSPATVNGRGTIMLEATASDPERDSLTYQWTSSGGGDFTDASVLNATWTAPPATDTRQEVMLTLTVTDAARAPHSDTVRMEVRANQAPMVSASPLNSRVSGGGMVTLDGTATDPEGDRLTYGWVSNGGGRFASASALDTTWTAPAKTNDEQNIALTLTATDNGAGALSDTATVDVTVRANMAPEVSVVPTSTTVNGGARVALDGTASDGDDTALNYAWTSNGGGTFQRASALDTTWTAPAATSSTQNIVLTITATDGTRASGTAMVAVTVRTNQAPDVSVGPESATVGGGATLTLDGTASDPEGTRMTYAWTSSGGGTFASASALDTRWTAPAATSSAQRITLTLEVTDAGGESAMATVAVTVPERNNTAPTVSATTSVSSVNGGGSVRLDGTASDPQNDQLTFRWASNGGGSFVDAAALDTRWTAPAAGTSDQDVTLTLTATDIDNASSAATVGVVVSANQAPRVSARARPTTVSGGGSVTLDGTATDPESDGLTYAWRSNGGGTFDDDSALDTTWTAPPKTNELQNVVLTLTVTDDGAGGRSGTANVDVAVRANQAPRVLSATAVPAMVNGRGRVTLRGRVADGDDSTLFYQWTSDRGGSFEDDTALRTTWTAQRATLDPEPVVLTLTVTDSTNASASQTASVTVLANQAPRVAVSPAGARVEGEEELTVSGIVTDPEGDGLTYEWRTSGGGSFDDPFAAETTWTAPPKTDTAQSITLTLTVTDDGEGSLRGIATVMVTVQGNQPLPVGPGSFAGGPPVGGPGGGPSGPSPSVVDFEWTVDRDIEVLDEGNGAPTGTWSDGTTLWVVDNPEGSGDAVYAYNLVTGERVESREFALAQENRAPRGIWSNGEAVWVSDSGQDRLFAYVLATGERAEEREFELARRNADPRGIWSDGETMWVLNQNPSLFAYDLATSEVVGRFVLDEANSDPRGIWSDGVTVWVSNHNPKRLFAYRLPTPPSEPLEEPPALERVQDEEFTELSKAGNNSPRGLWSDGDVMYVADQNDGRVYTYNMPDAIDARLASLSLAGVRIGEFSPARTEYVGLTPGELAQTTVEAEAAQPGARVVIKPADADEVVEGHQVAVTDDTEVTVTVTSEDGSRERVYRVRFDDPEQRVLDPLPPGCFRGDVVEGFSLLVYEGGSVDDLVVCALGRNVVAIYVLDDGIYVPYIIGAPYFVNATFVELYPDAIAPLTPLVVKSDGPPTAGPEFAEFTEEELVVVRASGCLRGDVVEGFSLVIHAGGSVDAVEECARSLGIAALYALAEGEYVPYIVGAPEFVNQPFRELFPDGLPPATPLVVKSDEPPASSADQADASQN